jgi:hypothetical protein
MPHRLVILQSSMYSKGLIYLIFYPSVLYIYGFNRPQIRRDFDGFNERIKNVAKRVAKWHDAGHQIVVVPSAMSGETNRIIGLAKEIVAQPDPRELDMIASTGEQVSVGLLSMALQAIGKQAVSYAGWQVPIKTDSAYTKARIESIDDAKVKADLDAGNCRHHRFSGCG